MPELWDDRYTPADAEVIRKKAARFSGKRFCHHDIEELQQEAAAHCFQQIPRHEPGKGSREKFLSHVAKNFLLNEVAKRTAARRDHRRDVRFEERPEGVLIDGTHDQARLELQLDLAEAIARMPPDLGQVWNLRRDGHAERALEGLLGCTRAQVRTFMLRLERFLRDAKLDPFSKD